MHHQNGAHRRVSDLLDFLVNCNCQVTLYSFYNHFDCPWGQREIDLFAARYPGVTLALDRRSRLFLHWTKARKFISSIAPSLTATLIKIRLPGATPEYDRLRIKYPNALYLINYANGLLELNGINPGHTVIETHDLDFLQFNKRHGFALTGRKVVGKFRSEFSLLDSASALIAISRVEAGIFRLFFPGKPVFFVPDYGGLHPRPTGRGTRPFEYDLLFVGSDHQLNVRGIVDFMRTHGDLLATHKLGIVGKVGLVPEVVKVAGEMPRVSLLGFVDNIDDVYGRSKIVISPVDGTGLKIKVIEALAAGKPVFGSLHSLEGLPSGAEECAFLIDEAQIVKMLSDERLLASAEKAAQAFASDLATKADLAKFNAFLTAIGACK